MKSWKTKSTASLADKYAPNAGPIDVDKIIAIRYAIYDNEPMVTRPLRETSNAKPRYKVEVQLWENTDIQCTHKLIGYASSLKTFGNLRYNDKLQKYREFYDRAFESARSAAMDAGAQDLVLHTGLGRRHRHSNNQNGYSLIPEIAATLVIRQSHDPVIMLNFGELVDIEELDRSTEKEDYTVYYKHKQVE